VDNVNADTTISWDYYDSEQPDFISDRDYHTVYGSDGKDVELVDSPAHYNVGSIEAIDAIESSMNFDETVGYLKGSALKYLFRYRYKGRSLEDLKKARWYLNRLIDKWEQPDA
jgi:hypothetical protein